MKKGSELMTRPVLATFALILFVAALVFLYWKLSLVASNPCWQAVLIGLQPLMKPVEKVPKLTFDSCLDKYIITSSRSECELLCNTQNNEELKNRCSAKCRSGRDPQAFIIAIPDNKGLFGRVTKSIGSGSINWMFKGKVEVISLDCELLDVMRIDECDQDGDKWVCRQKGNNVGSREISILHYGENSCSVSIRTEIGGGGFGGGGGGGVDDIIDVEVTEAKRSPEEVADVMEHAAENSLINRKCACGDDCDDYASWIVKYSIQYGIPDPLLPLSMMMQESGCNPKPSDGKVCNSYGFCGLMQIEDKVSGYDNPETNIKEGIKHLKEKYDTYKGGYSSQGCFSQLEYYGWQAAVRGYVGWGCNNEWKEEYESNPNNHANTYTMRQHDLYVKNVMLRYDELRKVAVA